MLTPAPHADRPQDTHPSLAMSLAMEEGGAAFWLNPQFRQTRFDGAALPPVVVSLALDIDHHARKLYQQLVCFAWLSLRPVLCPIDCDSPDSNESSGSEQRDTYWRDVLRLSSTDEGANEDAERRFSPYAGLGALLDAAAGDLSTVESAAWKIVSNESPSLVYPPSVAEDSYDGHATVKAALDFLRKAQSCYAALSALYDMTQRLWPVVAAAEVTEAIDEDSDLVTVLDRSLSTLKCAFRLIDAMQTSAAVNQNQP